MQTQSTLLHNTSPEQLAENIFLRFKSEFDDIKKQFQPKQATEYLTRNEVKDFFKVDLSTVHNWTKKGKLKAYGIGARVYYKRNEVEQVLIPLNF